MKAFIIFFIFTLSLIPVNKSYKDGNYSGASRSVYTDEPYYGIVNISIENGSIIKVDFVVRDSAKHVYFDDEFEKYFEGIEEYKLQCRNDRKGVMSYPDSLLKYQDPDSLDAVSGATWSFNIFKASVEDALSSAIKE